MHTREGKFSIGFRRGWGSWQQKSLSELADWATEMGFEFLDLMNLTCADIQSIEARGMRIGTYDLLDYAKLLSIDDAVRQATLDANLEMIPRLAAVGARKFFACLLGDDCRSRIDNFKMAITVMSPLCMVAAKANATVGIEGFPGQAPDYPGIGCTPESVRALLKEIPEGLGLNYDPSHLIRMGIDPIRYLREFGSHVVHVHAKDTELSPDGTYEFGLYQDSTFQPVQSSRRYSGLTWRYRLPGRGCANWPLILRILADNGYSGGISIELEDEDFLGSEPLEKSGLIASRDFLANLQ